MGTGSFPGVKRPGRGVDHPFLSSAEAEGRVELYICSPSGSSWPVLGRTLLLPRRLVEGFSRGGGGGSFLGICSEKCGIGTGLSKSTSVLYSPPSIDPQNLNTHI